MCIKDLVCVPFCIKAEECLDSCQLELALGWCERAHQLDPSSVRVLEAMGPLLLDLGYTDRAIQISTTDGVSLEICFHWNQSINETPKTVLFYAPL